MIYHNILTDVDIYLYTCLSTLTALYIWCSSVEGFRDLVTFSTSCLPGTGHYSPYVSHFETDSFQGSSLLVGRPGLSQGSVIWHGGEKGVPELAVDEEDNKQHQQKEQQAHDYVGDQVRFVELALPEPSSPSAGGRSQKTGHAHRAAVGGVQ